MNDEEALKHYFGPSIDGAPETIEACLSLCRTYNLSPEDLFYSWGALTYNTALAVKQLTPERLPAFRDHLQREFKKIHAVNTRKAPAASAQAKVGGAASRSGFGTRLQANAMPTPVKKEPVETKLESPTPLRTETTSAPVASGSGIRSRVVPAANIHDFSYRYMFEKMSEKTRVLEERVQEFSTYVREYYDIEDGDIGDPNAQTEEDVVVVGRICNASEDRLTENNIMFEPSRADGNGKRIPLGFVQHLQFPDHQATPSWRASRAGIGLFPGAIVAFRGKRKDGLEGPFFEVKELLPLPPLKPAIPKAITKGERSFSMLVAAGPYSFDSDLYFKPLHSVLNVMKRTKPDILFLQGPFLDANHPMLAAGNVEMTIPELFLRRIAAPIRDAIRDHHPEVSIAFMPSVRDLVSNSYVYPQAPTINVPQFATWNPPAPTPPPVFLSNPATFSIHGTTIAATTVDVIMHLRKEEVYKTIAAAEYTDPIGGSCRHLLDQRSIYPIYPVYSEYSHDVNLDLTHSSLLNFGETLPDLIILPGKLNHFKKIVDKTLFINPALASRAKSLGSVALITSDVMKGQGPERYSVEPIKLE